MHQKLVTFKRLTALLQQLPLLTVALLLCPSVHAEDSLSNALVDLIHHRDWPSITMKIAAAWASADSSKKIVISEVVQKDAEKLWNSDDNEGGDKLQCCLLDATNDASSYPEAKKQSALGRKYLAKGDHSQAVKCFLEARRLWSSRPKSFKQTASCFVDFADCSQNKEERDRLYLLARELFNSNGSENEEPPNTSSEQRYIDAIAKQISSQWKEPTGIQGKDMVVVHFTVNPDGQVTNLVSGRSALKYNRIETDLKTLIQSISPFPQHQMGQLGLTALADKSGLVIRLSPKPDIQFIESPWPASK